MIGLEPRGFRCPISQCEDPNNTAYNAINEDWLFPKDYTTNDYDYCNPYNLNFSIFDDTNYYQCNAEEFTKEEGKFNLNCSSKKTAHSIIHITQFKKIS